MGSLTVIGVGKLTKELRRASRRLPHEIEHQMEKLGEMVAGDAKRNFKGERTRARYKIKGGRRVARKPPRAVTSPPTRLGVFTGQYRKAISKEVQRIGTKIRAMIGPVGIPYARAHELGTGNQKKRPVLEPALKKNQKHIAKRLGRAFDAVLR